MPALVRGEVGHVEGDESGIWECGRTQITSRGRHCSEYQSIHLDRHLQYSYNIYRSLYTKKKSKSFKYMILMMYVAIMVLVATYIFNKSHELLRTNNKMPVAVEKVDARFHICGKS